MLGLQAKLKRGPKPILMGELSVKMEEQRDPLHSPSMLNLRRPLQLKES